MAKFSERLKQLRTEKGLSQQAFADRLGCISKSSINMYERGEREPGLELLEAIADFFNVDIAFLLGKSDIQNRAMNDILLPSNIIPMPEMRKIPLLGTIACGQPIFAEENIEDYIDIPKYLHADFALTCDGDSMINARIHPGDIVYIRKQEQVQNGEIAAVLIDNSATLKRFYYYPDKEMLILKAENPKYDDFIFIGSEIEQLRIIGKAIAFTSPIH